MFSIKGKLKNKFEPKVGVSETKGAWRIIEFFISSKINREEKIFHFAASGDLVDKINSTPLKTELEIEFYPKCTESNNRWYTSLRCISATIVEKKKRNPTAPNKTSSKRESKIIVLHGKNRRGRSQPQIRKRK